jgi:hypothetical protein
MATIKRRRRSRARTETVESWGPEVNPGFQIHFMEDHAQFFVRSLLLLKEDRMIREMKRRDITGRLSNRNKKINKYKAASKRRWEFPGVCFVKSCFLSLRPRRLLSGCVTSKCAVSTFVSVSGAHVHSFEKQVQPLLTTSNQPKRIATSMWMKSGQKQQNACFDQ